jgi:hypothetical protein
MAEREKISSRYTFEKWSVATVLLARPNQPLQQKAAAMLVSGSSRRLARPPLLSFTVRPQEVSRVEESPSRCGKRLRWFPIVAVVGLFACCGGLALFGDCPKNGVRVERLEADLNERLPDGSTWEQAEAWFASHGLRPGVISEMGGRKVGLAATIPNDSLLESAEIRIELYFSREGRLEKRVIYRFVYSL